MASRLIDDLVSVLGPDDVIVDDDVRAGYETDWTGRYGAPCVAVVRPRSASDVADVLRCCSEHGVAVVPQGGMMPV